MADAIMPYISYDEGEGEDGTGESEGGTGEGTRSSSSDAAMDVDGDDTADEDEEGEDEVVEEGSELASGRLSLADAQALSARLQVRRWPAWTAPSQVDPGTLTASPLRAPVQGAARRPAAARGLAGGPRPRH